MTDELLLKIYYQIQDEGDLSNEVALEMAKLRLSSCWTQEVEDDLLREYP